jgi:hypothetical protein
MKKLFAAFIGLFLFSSIACAGTITPITDNENNLMWIPATEMVPIGEMRKVCKKLNDENAHGYSNWRLPTGRDLKKMSIHEGNYWIKDIMMGLPDIKITRAINVSTGLTDSCGGKNSYTVDCPLAYIVPVRRIRSNIKNIK